MKGVRERVPRSIDYVRASLLIKGRRRYHVKAVALNQVADLVRVICAEALRGDAQCGLFLGELLPALHKTRTTIAAANQTFRERCNQMESTRFATAKDSAFRSMIEKIIANARNQKRKERLLECLPSARLIPRPNKWLLELPELTESTESVNAWTDKVVYPALRRQRRKLRGLYDQGYLQKARDEFGKFQISRLKPLIRATVIRIARVPPISYFAIT